VCRGAGGSAASRSPAVTGTGPSSPPNGSLLDPIGHDPDARLYRTGDQRPAGSPDGNIRVPRPARTTRSRSGAIASSWQRSNRYCCRPPASAGRRRHPHRRQRQQTPRRYVLPDGLADRRLAALISSNACPTNMLPSQWVRARRPAAHPQRKDRPQTTGPLDSRQETAQGYRPPLTEEQQAARRHLAAAPRRRPHRPRRQLLRARRRLQSSPSRFVSRPAASATSSRPPISSHAPDHRSARRPAERTGTVRPTARFRTGAC